MTEQTNKKESEKSVEERIEDARKIRIQKNVRELLDDNCDIHSVLTNLEEEGALTDPEAEPRH